MGKGTKRPVQSASSIPEYTDSALDSKRVMEAPSFDVHRAESSRRHHLMAEPPLDVQRAELSRQHVIALNTQFSSWVQSQLQNHPDELWDDGVRDYLTHSSHIMDKFSDVVAWLRANLSKGENISTAGLTSNQNRHLNGGENSKSMLLQQLKTGFGQEGTTTSLSNSWSSGLSSGSQAPNFSGIQSATTTKSEVTDDLDEENDNRKPVSPSFKKTEEKGVVVVLEVKCKVYIKADDAADKSWKDMGVGQLSIKCREDVSMSSEKLKPMIIVRNDVGKILLNALIYPGIKMNVQKNTIATIFHTSSGEGLKGHDGKNDTVVARTYLLRLKTEEDTSKLAAAIKEHGPTSI